MQETTDLFTSGKKIFKKYFEMYNEQFRGLKVDTF